MKILNNEEMTKVEGGGVKFNTVASIISGIVSFLLGILKGIRNACR